VVHRVKEDKVGLALGLASRMRMFSEVFAEWLRLRYDPPPPPSGVRRTGEAGLGFR
jgi:hypothetical protein